MEFLSRVLQIKVMTLPFAIAVVATVLAGISDALWYKIPNRLTYTLIAIGFSYHAVSPMGRGYLYTMAGFVFGLAILTPFFVMGGVGAGDVKLLAGIGCCVGLHDIVAVFLAFGTLTGVYSAAVMLVNGRWPAVAVARERVEDIVNLDEKSRRARLVPLAPMMAVAMLALALGSLWCRQMVLFP